MKIISRILRTLFGIYASILFIALLIAAVTGYFFVFTFFSKKSAPIVAHRISQWWAKVYYPLVFLFPEVKNKAMIDPEKTYVFIANHRSLLDIPVYALSCKNTFRFLAKEELTRLPLFGYIIKNLYISVKRSSKEDRALSLEKMKQSLADGISVFICPEGTRNKTPNPLLDLRDGAFRLAIEAQVPLAVLVVKDADKKLSPLRWNELAPGIIHAQWCGVIDTKGMKDDDMKRLKDNARNMMLEELAR